jgi:hypothetical protein
MKQTIPEWEINARLKLARTTQIRPVLFITKKVKI